tara:strand:- start:291 stop:425 length:135 start_codon:yes stop_codon:yes gene_type:complete
MCIIQKINDESKNKNFSTGILQNHPEESQLQPQTVQKGIYQIIG